MSNSNMLEIIQGLAQAAANGYDGALDDKGQPLKVGLKREEGNPIIDKRVNDGFKVKLHPGAVCIHYQSDVLLKHVYAGGFEDEIERQINEIKKFLQKEYKKITGNSITLTKDGEVDVMVQSSSRVRSFVQAYQYFKISGANKDEAWDAGENRSVDDSIKKFLEMGRQQAKKPMNVTRKKD